MKKPRKVAAYYVCSACGEEWEKHIDAAEDVRSLYEVTQEDCIRVLKAKPRTMPVITYNTTTGGQPAAHPRTWEAS